MPPSESLSSETLLLGWISEVSTCEVAGLEGMAPDAELRREKLKWEEALEGLDLPAEGGLPACVVMIICISGPISESLHMHQWCCPPSGPELVPRTLSITHKPRRPCHAAGYI